MKAIFRITLLSAVVMSATSGCGSDAPETAEVRGTVFIDGVPLERGGVFLRPSHGRVGKGKIGSDGSFVISTFSDGDGAIVGPARIAVRAVTIAGNAREGGEITYLVPKAFTSEDTSGLSYDVSGDTANILKIELASDGTGQVTKVD